MGLLKEAQQILRDAGHSVSVIPTTGPATAGGIARKSIEEGADLIVAAGGDGTIHEVVDGMVNSNVPLGILPGGTANVLANEIGLGNNLQAAAASLSQCVAHRITIGRIQRGSETRHFLSMAGAGFDADTVHRVRPKVKAKLGKVAYWITGFGQIVRPLPVLEAHIDGRAYPCAFALVSRVRNYGGDFEIARNVSLLDDSFEVALFEGTHGRHFVKYLLGMMLGRLEGMSGVSYLRADRVVLTGPAGTPVHIQTDGEYAGTLPATVDTVPDALTLLMPPRYLATRVSSIHPAVHAPL